MKTLMCDSNAKIKLKKYAFIDIHEFTDIHLNHNMQKLYFLDDVNLDI